MTGPERGPEGRGPGDGPLYLYPPYLAPYPEVDEVDLMDTFRALLARRRMILAIVALCTLAAVVISLLLPPVYRATAVIAPVEDESTGGLAGLMGELSGLVPGVSLGGAGSTQKQIAILTSRAFTVKLVEDNDLMPVLFADAWDPEAGRWTVPDDEVPGPWDAYRAMETVRTVEQDPKTGLVTVSIEWRDPQIAADWVRLHIDTLNRYLQADAIREAEESIAYLMEQVDRTSNVELRQTLFNLVEAQTKKAMLARVREDFAFKVIDPPVAPDKRAWPLRTLIVVVTFLASGLLAVVVALVIEFVARNHRRVGGRGASPVPPPPPPGD